MDDIFPPAPMPPPPGAIPVHDWPPVVDVPPAPRDRGHNRSPSLIEHFDDELKTASKPKNNGNNNRSGNKTKDKNGNKYDYTPIKPTFEGYVLERVPVRDGKLSWSRVGKRIMPGDNEKLRAIVIAHRRQNLRRGPMEDFANLSPNQQGVINRIISEKRMEERFPNADWNLADVQRIERRTWRTIETRKIQVILKRHDKNPDKNVSDKNANKTSDKTDVRKDHTAVYHHTDIIDLSDPMPGEKQKKKGGNGHGGGGGGKRKQNDDFFDHLMDDPLGIVIPPPAPHQQRGLPMPPPIPIHHHEQPPPPHDHMGPPIHPPNAIPIDQFHPNQFHPSARDTHYDNPFTPNPNVITGGHYDSPLLPHFDERDEVRSHHRPPTPRRRASVRQPDKDIKRLKNKVDILENEFGAKVDILENKLDALHVNSDSSEGRADDDAMWSPIGSGESVTSRSTSPPVGSLHRRKSSGRRLYEYRSRSRPRYLEDDRFDVIPGTTSRRGERRRHLEAPRYERRPPLRHAYTVDDYPEGKTAEPRYLPLPPRMQRRLTDVDAYDDTFEYDKRRRDERRFEAGPRYERRRSEVYR